MTTKPPLAGSASVSVDGCSPSQVADLLRLGLEQPEATDEHAHAKTRTSPPHTAVGGTTEPADLVQSVLSKSTTLDELRQLKTEAKRRLETAPAGPARDAARLLYHLSIAQALARFGVRISRIAPAKRRPVNLELASAFAGHPIGRVFAKAADLEKK
jgi:hypothetical protein